VKHRSNSAFVRDDGRYVNDPLKYWFDNLTSGNGNCCSFADGLSISDVDWDTKEGHYRVRLHGEWIDVPNSSVVAERNRYGPGGLAPTWIPTTALTSDASSLELGHKLELPEWAHRLESTRGPVFREHARQRR
jgi:hypothetical protein